MIKIITTICVLYLMWMAGPYLSMTEKTSFLEGEEDSIFENRVLWSIITGGLVIAIIWGF